MRPQALKTLREAKTFGDDVEDDRVAFSTEFEAIAIGLYMGAMTGRLVSCPGVPDMFDYEYCELFLSLSSSSVETNQSDATSLSLAPSLPKLLKQPLSLFPTLEDDTLPSALIKFSLPRQDASFLGARPSSNLERSRKLRSSSLGRRSWLSELKVLDRSGQERGIRELR